MSRINLDEVTAGKYELIVSRWDQITSKPGQPFDFTRHRRGDVVDLSVDEARRLVRAGAVKPAEGGKAQPATPTPAPADAVAVLDADGKPVNIDDITKAVGDDPAKAKATLEAEQARGDAARSTLVTKLEAVIAAAEGGQGS